MPVGGDITYCLVFPCPRPPSPHETSSGLNSEGGRAQRPHRHARRAASRRPRATRSPHPGGAARGHRPPNPSPGRGLCSAARGRCHRPAPVSTTSLQEIPCLKNKVQERMKRKARGKERGMDPGVLFHPGTRVWACVSSRYLILNETQAFVTAGRDSLHKLYQQT